MKKTTQILLIGGIVLAAATLAFAWNGHHNGRGYGNHMGGGYHSGNYGHMNNGYHMGDGDYRMHGSYNGSGFTDQDVKALNQEKKDFFNETRELRKKAYNTRMELEDEMSSGNPDMQKVEKLRNMLAELNNQLRNIHNDYPVMSEMRSQGVGRHMMRGAGYNGNGYCW
jgi:Spy/CpxP family protein refolding chaperone